MAVYGYVETQTVQPNTAAILNDISPCQRGFVLHRAGSGILTLRGIRNCPCGGMAKYHVKVSGNMAVSTGGTVGEIQIALAIAGEVIPITIAAATPAAVEEFWSFSREYDVEVPLYTSADVTVKNATVDAVPIDLRNLQLLVSKTA